MSNVYEGSGGDCYELPDVDLTEQDRANMAVLDGAFRRWKSMGPVSIELDDRRTAYLVMALLQLTIRHPEQPFSGLAEKVGRQLQDEICDQDDIRAIAEAGWNPEADR